jgi:hypothetical protein
MLKQLFRKAPPVPQLVVSQRVIDKMLIAANRFIEDETGEAMVGFITRQNDQTTIYVLDTISPDDSAVRQLHTFQQGDELQDEILWWLRENWHQTRKNRGRGLFQKRDEWDVPLSYLGDWHKQPGNMIVPSGGDLQTALDWLDDHDNKTDFLLVPIVTLDHPATVDTQHAPVNYISIPQGDGSAVRVDWWYVHREWGLFQPITPKLITDEDSLPKLAPIPWHLKDQDFAQAQWNALEDAGIAITLLLAEIDHNPPLEVCISGARIKGGEKIYLLVTNHDFPHTPPQMRLAPFVSLKSGQSIADMFTTWWEKAEPVQPPADFIWSTEKTLLDYIIAVETRLGIYKPPVEEAPQPDPTDPIEIEKTEGDI